jgi:hypothetical protein
VPCTPQPKPRLSGTCEDVYGGLFDAGLPTRVTLNKLIESGTAVERSESNKKTFPDLRKRRERLERRPTLGEAQVE